jgi:hypothetical protein
MNSRHAREAFPKLRSYQFIDSPSKVLSDVTPQVNPVGSTGSTLVEEHVLEVSAKNLNAAHPTTIAAVTSVFTGTAPIVGTRRCHMASMSIISLMAIYTIRATTAATITVRSRSCRRLEVETVE